LGDEDTDDATDHESFELSELKDTSTTPLGLPGSEQNLRLFERSLKWSLRANSIKNLLQSSTLSCFRHNQDSVKVHI